MGDFSESYTLDNLDVSMASTEEDTSLELAPSSSTSQTDAKNEVR